MIIIAQEYKILSPQTMAWVKYGGWNWPSPIHALCAAKCESTENYLEKWKLILKCATPDKAEHISKNWAAENWDQIKTQKLKSILEEYLIAHPPAKKKLLSTKEELIYLDSSWLGASYNIYLEVYEGPNAVGNCLQEIRKAYVTSSPIKIS
jgi:predicted NAD-dependent protein-ADP-ribosyltransferase YbiA (DUF1768 family)